MSSAAPVAEAVRSAPWAHRWVRPAAALAGGVIALGLLLVAPSVLSDYTVGVLTVVLFTLPGAIALNIVFGLCGQVSAGNAAFLALGSFSAAYLTRALPDAPTLAVLVGAALIGALAGFLVGAPAVRVRGLLLLISTLAFHFIVLYAMQRYQTEAVGSAGFFMPEFDVFGWKPFLTPDWFRTFSVLAVLSMGLFALLRHSPLGRSWLAIRDNEVAAQVLGVRVVRAKLWAFVISSSLIAVQGALYAYFVGTLQYENFTFDMAIQYIAIVIIGGLGSLRGVVAGTLLVVSLPYVLRSLSENLESRSGVGLFITDNIYDLQSLGYGLLIVVFLLFSPDGLDGLLRMAGQKAAGLVGRRRAPAPAPGQEA